MESIPVAARIALAISILAGRVDQPRDRVAAVMSAAMPIASSLPRIS